MPDKYINGNENNKHLKNTDNEDTMLISGAASQGQRSQGYRPPQGYQQGSQQYRPPQGYQQGSQQYRPPQGYQQGSRQYRPPQGYQQSSQRYRPPQGQYPPHRQYPPPPPPQKPPKKRKKKRKSLIGKIIFRLFFSLLIIFLILFGIYSCTALSIIAKINKTDTGERSHYANAMSEKYVTNVLVIGTDGRSENEQSRSDSIILVSLNSRTDEIIMTSFMRDCYVNIPGRGMDKLNSSYFYGGADLLMDTIESNFGIRIDNYITINFSTFASIVDAAGGVRLDISDDEAQAVNEILINEVNELMGDDKTDDLLDGGGKLLLNGKQALSYSRIRYVGNNDFERTERQRRVMTLLIKKAASNGISFVRNVTKSALPKLSTNMSAMQLYLLSLRAPFILRYDTKQLRVPADGTYGDDPNTPSGWVITVDTDANREMLEDEIFGDR